MRQAYATYPGTRSEIRRFVRQSIGPALGWRRRYPIDPNGLRERMTVPPETDGRPGYEVAVPGPGCRIGPLDPYGNRDATVPLKGGAVIIIKSLGAVGAVPGGEATLDAAGRADEMRAQAPASWIWLGPAEQVETGAGTGWRITATLEGARTMFADTHIDRDGWAYVVGAIAPPSRHADVARVADAMLDTWCWVDPLVSTD